MDLSFVCYSFAVIIAFLWTLVLWICRSYVIHLISLLCFWADHFHRLVTFNRQVATYQIISVFSKLCVFKDTRFADLSFICHSFDFITLFLG